MRRVAALIYDGFLVFGITMVYGSLALMVEKWIGLDTTQTPPLGVQLIIWAGLIYCNGYYFLYCWRLRGQTLGMKVWRLQLIAEQGVEFTTQRYWTRILVAVVSLAAAGLGFFWSLLPGNRTWHGIYSKTRVVVLPKPAKK